VLDAYDLARLNGFTGTREEFFQQEYLSGGIGVAEASGFDGTESQLTPEPTKSTEAAALALLDLLKGDTGLMGPRGPQGEDGLSAYQLAQQTGFTGTLEDYLASLKGDTGPQGKTGQQGPQGDQGEQGPEGMPGDPGETGDMPKHQVDNNKVRFERPDGTWGDWIDLGTASQQIGTSTGGSLSIQRFFADVASFPTVGKEQVLYFDMSASPWGTYVWTGTAYQATGGGADIIKDWGFYSTNWSVQPAIVGTTAAGTVYQYVLGSVTRYRLVPSPYLPTADSFYLTFAAGVLSDLVATRG
jgi:hypothetical protein